MLHINLSTRPFYNQRAVRAALALAGAAALGLSVFTAARLVSLTRAQRDLAARAADADRRAQERRAEAERLLASVDRAEVEAVRLAVQEANRLIERRAFSWTVLFDRFEATLPANVRITGVSPQADAEGRLVLAVTVLSRDVADLDAFIQRLEETGAFRAVLARQEEVLPDGMLRSMVQGYYGATTAAAPPSSEPSGEPHEEERGSPPAGAGPPGASR